MTDDDFYYFAYGSNMSERRLKERCPSAQRIGRASLNGWRFKYSKISIDGSAKANLIKDDTCEVIGVIWRISNYQLATLQEAEGCSKKTPYESTCNSYYTKKIEPICYETDVAIACITYISSQNLDNELPYDWYVNYCQKGEMKQNYLRNILKNSLIVS